MRVVSEDSGGGPVRAVTVKAEGSTMDRFVSRPDEGGGAGIGEYLEPPYNLKHLCVLAERSNSLRANVDAYVTNIDSFGHRFAPAIRFSDDDSEQQIKDAILATRLAERPSAKPSSLDPNPVDVRRVTEELLIQSRAEKARLTAFFSSCCDDISFVELRRRTRQDLENTGNGYWEVLRAVDGTIAKLAHVQSHTVRLLKLDAEPTQYTDTVRVSAIAFKQVPALKRFRRYVQLDDYANPIAFFKQFGDPRVVSAKTGEVFDTIQVMRREEGKQARQATELVHFKLYSGRSSYGIPRWIGNSLSVVGSRSMEEVNVAYFESKAVPPLAVLVSGGARLSDKSVERLTRFMDEHLRGKENFHSIMVLQAESDKKGARGGERARIELKPLTSAQLQDATHQEYDNANREKVGASFRLPRILRGNAENVNRATAEAAIRLSEDQVFQPERDSFDYFMNRVFMPAIGARFWSFVSQTRVTRDPDRAVQNVERLVKAGVLTPEEGRELAEDILNRDLRPIKEDWVTRPLTLTLAGIQTSQRGPETARKIMDIRDRMLESAGLSVADLAGGYLAIEPDPWDVFDAE